MFVIGQYSLMAVDAYNGRHLWRRDFPRVGWWHVRSTGSSAVADEDGVYLVQGKVCLRLDGATGETVQTYELPALPGGIPEAMGDLFQWRYLAVDHNRILGSMGNEREGKILFVLGKDGYARWTYRARGVAGSNALSMDESRVYLIDQTHPREIAEARRRGRAIPITWTLVALDAARGLKVWQTDHGIEDRTQLWLSQGVLLATSRSGMTGYDAATGRQLYSREVRMGRFPVIARGTIYAEPDAYDLRTGEPKRRANPFTGGEAPWHFRRSYGCGSIAGAPNVLLFRSGTLGMYDLAGDSGIYNFGGVRAGCFVNAIAANGLVLAPPADAGCTCSYSFQTTVALMPAEKQPDWSIFYDRLPTTSVEQGAFNLGAPGDRRDESGAMWLALPRPKTRSHRSDIAVPFRFIMLEGFGAYRHDPDRARITGTDRPWLYTSGLKGLQRAELDVNILDRGVYSWPTEQPPTVDGRHAEPCWDGYKSVDIARRTASVTLRHDGDNLYLLYERPAAMDEAGKVVPWKAAAQGNDAAIWGDDSFELYISGIPDDHRNPSKSCLHLGVSASGARYDALWEYVTPTLPTLDIPRLDITINGKVDDWGDNGLNVLSLPGREGKMRAPNDFDPSFRIGWNETGLLVLVQVKDNIVHEWENDTELWRGDSVEIFIAAKAGTPECYQCIITPGSAPQYQPQVRFYDHRVATAGATLTAEVAGRKTAWGYLVEALLPWKNLQITPTAGLEFAMQLFANDDDIRGERHGFQALWHQAGNPTEDPLACQTFRLATQPGPPIEFKRGKKQDRDGLFTAAPPYPLPITVPSLGANPEDPQYEANWSSAVQADQEAFIVEVAIPWETLADVGLYRANLMVDIYSRGPLRRPPVMGKGFERVILIPGEMTRPRTLSLRLHFAELEDVKPGERVFDVRLQGKVVLHDFDVLRAARGRNRAVVKEFNDIVAARMLALELIPKAAEVTASTAPIISGIEVVVPGAPR